MKRLNRYKKEIAIFFIVVSFLLIGFNYTQVKDNVNTISNEKLYKICLNTDSIGEDTYHNLVENRPYNDITKLAYIEGIGDKKYQVLKGIFKTDGFTIRKNLYIASLIIMIISNVIGALILFRIHLKNTYNRMVTKELINNKLRQR